jgi:hypothetical protein
MIAFQSGGNANWNWSKRNNSGQSVVRCGNNRCREIDDGFAPTPGGSRVRRFGFGQFPQTNAPRQSGMTFPRIVIPLYLFV